MNWIGILNPKKPDNPHIYDLRGSSVREITDADYHKPFVFEIILKYKKGEKSIVFKAKDAKERSDWVSLIHLREM